MWNILIVGGAFAGSAVIWIIGMKLGWPWAIGFWMGIPIGHWARDFLEADQKEQQAQRHAASEDSR